MPVETHQVIALKLLAPARESWDLRDPAFSQPDREGWVGLALSGGKQLLQAVYRQVLEPQRTLNQQLVELTTRAIAGDDERLAGEVKAIRSELRSSAPSGAAAAAAAAIRYASLRGFEQLVSPMLLKQRTWNLDAWELLDRSLGGEPASIDRVHELLGRLTPRPDDQTGALSAASKIWFEELSKLFSKQAAFNRSIAATLGVLSGIPRPADKGRGYPELLLEHEARRAKELASALKSVSERPLISIVTPLWETPTELLRACIDSVRAQSYENWELCLADDGSKHPEIRAVLAEYSDPRIKYQLLPVNGGIARATNAGLAMARGQFVGFLDHDDTLAPTALAEVVVELERAPDTDLFFSDEDRLDLQGCRNLPFFKPGWSPDMLTSGNYVCHFLVVRRELVEQVGRIREGYDGAQDFDLVLRLWEATPRIRHIPEVLYHWRATPLSTAVNVDNKPQAGHAGARALAEHLVRCQVVGKVFSPAPTQYYVRYSVIGTPRVAVVTAPRAGADAWIRRFAFCRNASTELFVVGGVPVDGARTIRWEGARDLGAMYARAVSEHPADVYVFLDEALEPTDEKGITELVAQATRPEIGVVGCKLVYPDSTIRHAGLWVTPEGALVHPFQHMADDGDWTTIGNSNYSRNCIAVSGACFATRAEVISRAGGFGSGSAPELDACAQARVAGLRVVCSPFARFIHGGLEADPVLARPLGPDPYLNPNVDPASTCGGVRRRP